MPKKPTGRPRGRPKGEPKMKNSPAVPRRNGRETINPARRSTEGQYNLTQLNPTHWAFMHAYVRTRNARQAYMETHPNVTPISAGSLGSKLLGHPLIAEQLDILFAEYAEALKVDTARVLGEVAKIAFVNVKDLFTDGGERLKSPHEMDNLLSAAVQSIDVETVYERDGKRKRVVGHIHKIRLYNKLDALEKLGKHLNLFTDRHELTGKDGKDLFPKDKAAEIDVARRLAFILNRGKMAARKPTT